MIRIYKNPTAVILRNPEWGDIDRMNLNAISRYNRTGDLIQRKPSEWPTIFSFEFVFTRLTESVKDDFKSLMVANPGQEFNISRVEDGPTTMWSYDGYIITPIFDIVVVRETCSYDLSFTFQVKNS